MKRWTGATTVAAAVIAVGSIAMAGVGIGFAAAKSGVIHGCVAKSNGALRVVGKSGDCTAHESPLSFNKRGPRGVPGTAAQSTTYQMFANVDAEGDLGSHVDATKALKLQPEDGVYYVTFNKPIGACSASAQPGEAGGTDSVVELASAATFVKDQPDTWQVSFFNAYTNRYQSTPFMLTVTCPGTATG